MTLLSTPGKHFLSLPSVLPELREYGVCQPSDNEVESFKRNVYDKYLYVLSRHITGRFPDVALIEGFGIFDPVDLPHDLTLHATHGADLLLVLTDHYGHHGIIDTEASKVELRTFNSVVASNVELKRMSPHQLMSHLLKVAELNAMFPNLAKLAAIGLLLPLSTVDCERGFSTFTRVKTNLRNRLASKTLNNLLVISIEVQIQLIILMIEHVTCGVCGDIEEFVLMFNFDGAMHFFISYCVFFYYMHV